MHSLLEIIMPPTDDVEGAIATIMAPFNEQPDEDQEDVSSYTFWDWYVIGGRFSGSKLQSRLDPEKITTLMKN